MYQEHGPVEQKITKTEIEVIYSTLNKLLADKGFFVSEDTFDDRHTAALYFGSGAVLGQKESIIFKTFLAAHLAGHSVQLALRPEHGFFVTDKTDLTRFPELESKLRGFEIEASEYGAGFLIEAGAQEFIPRYSLLATLDRGKFIRYCRGEPINKRNEEQEFEISARHAPQDLKFSALTEAVRIRR